MTQEEKDLLLRDLCARLPYGVKIEVTYSKDSGSSLRARLCSEGINTLDTNILGLLQQSEIYIKPYLFPLSSMTEEQIEEAKTYFWKDVDYGKSLIDKGINCFYPCFNILEFYHKYHLDYRGLIPKGLAIDCTGLSIY
jgi:hypothetical protein